MSKIEPTCPAPRSKVVDLYFMEHRAKLLDIAAFLDRVDRAEDDTGGDDFRMAAFRRAMKILSETGPGRARRVLELFSDHTTTPLASAAGLKGAHGAYPG
ncbi:MAG: hypothetical protein ACYTGC_05150 [Planctomycetota bacterium]|jgi:hypothetical protein